MKTFKELRSSGRSSEYTANQQLAAAKDKKSNPPENDYFRHIERQASKPGYKFKREEVEQVDEARKKKKNRIDAFKRIGRELEDALKQTREKFPAPEPKKSEVKEHIIRVGNEYRLLSQQTGKNLGTYPFKAGAEKRERQV
jgi:hypothetical protein